MKKTLTVSIAISASLLKKLIREAVIKVLPFHQGDVIFLENSDRISALNHDLVEIPIEVIYYEEIIKNGNENKRIKILGGFLDGYGKRIGKPFWFVVEATPIGGELTQSQSREYCIPGCKQIARKEKLLYWKKNKK